MEEESKAPDYGMENDRRVRAWVLVKAEDPEKLSNELADEYRETRYRNRVVEFGKGGGELVVVRADAVDDDPSLVEAADACESETNLVIPVDAANKGILRKFVGNIQKRPGVTVLSILAVQKHNPDPPHASSTFVTGTEFDLDPVRDYDPPGRHPHSPGRNAWG